ncbi:MAG: SIR2 family protein [Thalassospira sp.]|uniref:SIR2 family protein n=1 Tax=Thalassospira sp. TaxID=1912094 RepID=UPI001B16EB38|nr:SIR2 family protein [Thalassospira sp.]MBO6842077.1 SIR2 family protein [Thalassospira sp.]
MPELIQNGPDVPVELLNLRDDGKVVFFCGSGISVATGLPMFDGLVSRIYEKTALTPSELESELLEQKQLDKVLGLLESRLTTGRLRREAPNILSAPPPDGALAAHKALLSLSRHAGRDARLVTTNFDNRFELADETLVVDAAPKLPIPKPQGWDSVVYLHGRISDSDPEGKDIVLTAADFGRAYLTERWASRFITELFREFTIVFVGYSLSDPVMSYMVDALAAERHRGARFQEAYAFAGYDSGEEGRSKQELSWRGKNVTPILFNSESGFSKLTDTFVRWAEITRDPITLRRQIVFDQLRNLPANAEDPTTQRVIWALSDKTTAKALAEADVLHEESEFPVLAAWLEVFDEAGLMSRPVVKPIDDSLFSVPIVSSIFAEYTDAKLDDVTEQLSIWLSKHLHVPQVLNWVARKGGCFHPFFRSRVRFYLSQKRYKETGLPEIPERLRLLWTVLVQTRPIDHDEDLWWQELISNAQSDDERRLVERAFIENSKPYLKVVPGPSRHLTYKRLDEDDHVPLTFLQECAHLKLVTDGRHWRRARFDRSPLRDEFLANHALEITEYLRRAIQLLSLDEVGFTLSWFYRPAIEDHHQNRDRPDWTFLIDWARDAYFVVAATNRSLADLILELWLDSGLPLFHRLALHVLAEDTDSDIRQANKLLLDENAQNLWSEELYHEVIVFLRKAGNRLGTADLARLVHAIQTGPSSGDVGDEDNEIREGEVSFRLNRLVASGAEVDPEIRRIARAFEIRTGKVSESDEFLTWVGEASWVNPDDYLRRDWLDGPELKPLIEEMQKGETPKKEFSRICMTWPVRAFSALRKLAGKGDWPAEYWREFFWRISALRREEKILPRIPSSVAALVVNAPDDFYSEVTSSISFCIEDFSKDCSIENEGNFATVWNRAWTQVVDETNVDADDVLTQALNSAAGQLAEAALNRLWKYHPKAGQGLPEPVKFYFENIASSSLGRLGRIILAAKLSNLYAIAPDWARRSLLPYSDWSVSSEAKDFWVAYAWAARAGPNLLAAFKDDFLIALKKYTELGDKGANLINLFVAASNDPKTIISPAEVHDVVAALPQDGLVAIARFFKGRLGENKEEQANIWNQECLPWLRVYWPKVRDKNTSDTSLALVGCIIKTGAAFPEALSWAKEFLRSGLDHILLDIQDSEIYRQYPHNTLEMLAIMIPENSRFEGWHKHTLLEILNSIQELDGAIVEDIDFRRLFNLAS